MPISEQDKQRLQKYLEKREQEAKHLASKNSFKENKTSSDEVEIVDVYSLLVKDLISQMQANSPEIASKTEVEMELLKSKLLIQIFNQALVLALEDQSDFDNRLIQDFTDSESYDEIMLKVGIYIQGFPEFAYKILVYSISTYILYCLEYAMIPNQKAVDIYFTFASPFTHQNNKL